MITSNVTRVRVIYVCLHPRVLRGFNELPYKRRNGDICTTCRKKKERTRQSKESEKFDQSHGQTWLIVLVLLDPLPTIAKKEINKKVNKRHICAQDSLTQPDIKDTSEQCPSHRTSKTHPRRHVAHQLTCLIPDTPVMGGTCDCVGSGCTGRWGGQPG